MVTKKCTYVVPILFLSNSSDLSTSFFKASGVRFVFILDWCWRSHRAVQGNTHARVYRWPKWESHTWYLSGPKRSIWQQSLIRMGMYWTYRLSERFRIRETSRRNGIWHKYVNKRPVFPTRIKLVLEKPQRARHGNEEEPEWGCGLFREITVSCLSKNACEEEEREKERRRGKEEKEEIRTEWRKIAEQG